MHNPIVPVTATGRVTAVDLRRPLSQLPAEVVLPVPSPGLISKATAMAEWELRSIRSKQREESSQRFPSFLPSIRRLLVKTGLFRPKSECSRGSKS